MKDMEVVVYAGTPKEIGAAVAQARQNCGWTQAELARRVGVNRKWIISLESGSPNVRLSLVLRTLRALNLEIDLIPSDHGDDLAELLTLVGRS
ncbi:helix-turn-helix transcriptional regulator [Actinomyces mediterranea]|uniref:helix-turn-helix transcriptional regulator n=1 Tax=Actinomyces mediterranea TaxID=1871028 RepID=UPI001968547E|nr:helix-turn-helix domain-containing protein [Actinomyces mediterranea]